MALKLIEKYRKLLTAMLLIFLCFAATFIYFTNRKFSSVVIKNTGESSGYILSLEDYLKEAIKSDIFVEHMRKYPASLDMLKETPRFRIAWGPSSKLVETFLDYLNKNPKVAEKIYNSKDTAKAFDEEFYKFDWK